MSEKKRERGRPHKGVIQRTFTLSKDAAEFIDSFPDGHKSDFVNSLILGEKSARERDLKQVAQDALSQAKSEGLDDEDARWMATGAINREARNQGAIGDELSAEMNAAAQAIVKQAQRGNSQEI
jgi:hypothetical protein